MPRFADEAANTVAATDHKKEMDRASIIWKVKPKNFDDGHLTRIHKGAGHSGESKASHSSFSRFLAFGSYVFDILVLYRVYSSTWSLLFFIWVLPIWRQSGFKKLDSKTILCSIQSFF